MQLSEGLIIIKISSIPDAIASSTTYWIAGLSTIGNMALGWAFVAGKNRVPNPATGIMALRIFKEISPSTV